MALVVLRQVEVFRKRCLLILEREKVAFNDSDGSVTMLRVFVSLVYISFLQRVRIARNAERCIS